MYTLLNDMSDMSKINIQISENMHISESIFSI